MPLQNGMTFIGRSDKAGPLAVSERHRSMFDTIAKARAFAALHQPGAPLLLANAWDAGSARAVAEAGARAIATSSWSVAAAHGADDGEGLALEQVLENARRIAASVDLPVSCDFERGYGVGFEDVFVSVRRLFEAGIVGLNIEDGLETEGTLRPAAQQAARIAACRAAADALGIPAFINARTDSYLANVGPASGRLDVTLERAAIYARAGASGIFVPGLNDIEHIRRLTASSPLPVNIMAGPDTDLAALARAGVARISMGPSPYRHAMGALAALVAAGLQSLSAQG